MDEITHTIMPGNNGGWGGTALGAGIGGLVGSWLGNAMPDPIRVVFYRESAGLYPPDDTPGRMAGGECLRSGDHGCPGQQAARIMQD